MVTIQHSHESVYMQGKQIGDDVEFLPSNSTSHIADKKGKVTQILADKSSWNPC